MADKKIISRAEIISIAKHTEGQSKNPKWFEQRKNKLTASIFGKALRASENPTPENIASLNLSITGSTDLSHIKAVKWGLDFEDAAIASYRRQTGNKVKRTGIWLFPDACLGSSPDGLIFNHPNDPEPRGVLEVKCPYSVRFLHFADMQAENLLPRYITPDLELNQDHDYYHQVQGEIYATEAKWCDFVMWTTQSTLIIRVFPYRDWVAECLPKLSDYYKRHFLPTSLSAQ